MQDKRRSARWTISLEARIRATSPRVGVDFPGQVVNISGGGVLIEVQGKVPVGTAVEIVADWPAVRENSRGSVLVILGRVVRSQPEFVAVEIGRYTIRPLGAR